MDQVVKDKYKTAVKLIGAAMKKHGYSSKGGGRWLLIRDNNCGVVWMQKSRGNVGGLLRFTVNVEIYYGDIWGIETMSWDEIAKENPHVALRLGHFLPNAWDAWWEIEENTDVSVMTAGVIRLLEEGAIPYLDRFLDSREIIVFWESGQFNGQSEFSRAKYLRAMKEKGTL